MCHAHLKRGIRTVGAKNLKKYPKDAESWITEGRFSVRPDRERGNPLKPSIYLKMSPLFCKFPVRLKRGIRNGRAKNLKKYKKMRIRRSSTTAFRTNPIGSTATRQPGNPLKPVRTRGNADKNLANAIVTRFQRISSELKGRLFNSSW